MKKSKRILSILSSVCSAAIALSCIVPTLSSVSAEEIITLPAEVWSSYNEEFKEVELDITSSNADDLLHNYRLQQSGVKPKSDSM